MAAIGRARSRRSSSRSIRSAVSPPSSGFEPASTSQPSPGILRKTCSGPFILESRSGDGLAVAFELVKDRPRGWHPTRKAWPLSTPDRHTQAIYGTGHRREVTSDERFCQRGAEDHPAFASRGHDRVTAPLVTPAKAGVQGPVIRKGPPTPGFPLARG